MAAGEPAKKEESTQLPETAERIAIATTPPTGTLNDKTEEKEGKAKKRKKKEGDGEEEPEPTEGGEKKKKKKKKAKVEE